LENRGAPTNLKEDRSPRQSRPARCKDTGPERIARQEVTENPEAATNIRERLSLNNQVGDTRKIESHEHSRSLDEIIEATFGKRQVGQADQK
jgi:hypothetical protein